MKRYCLTLDLKDDPELIRAYEAHHKAVWPGIVDSIRNSGIRQMEIYRHETRLFMIMEVEDHFSFEKKGQMDAGNPEVQKWEQLMWDYQQPLAGSAPGEKWKLMNRIFDLTDF